MAQGFRTFTEAKAYAQASVDRFGGERIIYRTGSSKHHFRIAGCSVQDLIAWIWELEVRARADAPGREAYEGGIHGSRNGRKILRDKVAVIKPTVREE
jgi:hypothetical protein